MDYKKVKKSCSFEMLHTINDQPQTSLVESLTTEILNRALNLVSRQSLLFATALLNSCSYLRSYDYTVSLTHKFQPTDEMWKNWSRCPNRKLNGLPLDVNIFSNCYQKSPDVNK